MNFPSWRNTSSGTGGATAIIVDSVNSSIQQNGSSIYDSNTNTITVDLSTSIGSGIRKGVINSSTNILSGETAIFNLIWDTPFTNNIYNVYSINVESDSNSILIATSIKGTKTLTGVQIQVFNASATIATNITINAIGA